MSEVIGDKTLYKQIASDLMLSETDVRRVIERMASCVREHVLLHGRKVNVPCLGCFSSDYKHERHLGKTTVRKVTFTVSRSMMFEKPIL